MDLDEFLKIHEKKLTKEKEVHHDAEKRPTEELLSNLLERVNSRTNKKRENECLKDIYTEKDDTKESDSSSSSTSRSLSPTFPHPRSLMGDTGLKTPTCNINIEPARKKSNRSFVPEDQKDDKYWERRRKNNEAAKKSRKDRRKKELEVYKKVSQLEIINSSLVAKIATLEERNKELERKLSKYTEKLQG